MKKGEVETPPIQGLSINKFRIFFQYPVLTTSPQFLHTKTLNPSNQLKPTKNLTTMLISFFLRV